MKKLALIGCIIGLVAATSAALPATDRGPDADLGRAIGLGAPASFGLWPAGPLAYEATVAISAFAPHARRRAPQ